MKTVIKGWGVFLIHNLEAIVWIAAILAFALSPMTLVEHISICPLSIAGFEHCPGCGLGRSLILLLHGKVSESMSMHPLAFPALALLAARVVIVFKNYFYYQKQITQNLNI